MTAASPDVAGQIAALEACIGRCEVRGELVAYDGPEPVEERLSGWTSDRRAEAAENAQERQWAVFER